LYFATATINAGTTAYTTTGEVTNTSGTGYTAGGYTLTGSPAWYAPTATNSSATAGVAFTTPTGNFVYGSSGSPMTVTTAFDTVLIYNSSQSNAAVSVHTFGSQTITAGIFTLTMPTTNTTSTALLRLSTT
jgi:hypothetical protein